jgi:integrase
MPTSVNLSTAAKRRRLGSSKSIYWNAVGGARAGLKLGHRKSSRRGSWVAKIVCDGLRAETTLGTADDDGCKRGALNHSEAIAAALTWAKSVRERGGVEAAELTVGEAARVYVEHREHRNPIAGRDARYRLGLHVLGDPRFASIPLTKLKTDDIHRWRKSLPHEMRPASVNRLMNDLRAALRAAIEERWRELPASLAKEIEIGLRSLPSAEIARHALLSDDQIRRVVDAAYGVDHDLGALVLTLAATGGRFSQIARITVADVQVEAERILVPTSAKGKGPKARARIAVPVGADVIAQLMPLIEGRASGEPLLMRWIHRQVNATTWERVERVPWSVASHMQRGWRKALKAAGVSHVEAYALRHSSIVRQLREGLPVRVVAGLHDTSTAMIERHYSAHILDMADELARRAITTLVETPRALIQVG